MGLSLGNSFFRQPVLFGRAVPNAQESQNPFQRPLQDNNPSVPIGVSGGLHGSGQDRFERSEALQAGKKPTQEFEAFKARQYSKLLAHEQAHASAAGSLGGGIHIQYDNNGVAVAGHVPISIPGLDRQNPETSYKNYDIVRSAALAPGDPSSPDLAVAATAEALKGQAQILMGQKKQAQSAGVSLDTYRKLGGNTQALKRPQRHPAQTP